MSGSTIIVAPGSYTGGFTIGLQVNLLGAQAGVSACGRTAVPESIITGGGLLLRLVGGCAGTVIDGFTFSGANRGIESTSGPINGVQILNNKFDTLTSSAIFLNDSGVDVTVSRNEIDGSSSGSGGAAPPGSRRI